MKRFTIAGALAAGLVLVVVGAAVAKKPEPPPPVTIQILNVSDWHGNVDPVANAGGAWNISARWQEDRLAYPTLTLTAGDDFSASPALSNFFNEEPAVKAERLMGIQVNTLGNHNFDRGVAHLQQMIDLAGAPTSPDAPGTPYSYVSANLKNVENNLTGVEPYKILEVGGAKIAVIGITNEEAPNLVLPGAFGTITVTDGVPAANRYAAQARRNGADAVIVITHKGVRTLTPEPAGELIDFANAVSPGLIDVIVGDHTDIQFSGIVNGILVHENRSFGVTYAKTLLTIQPGVLGSAGGVIDRSVSFVSPAPSGALSDNNTSCGALTYCDQAVVDMLVPYRVQLAALLDEPVGTTTEPFKRGANLERGEEVALGDLIADGMRWRYGTQLALINSGGIRSQLPACSYQPVDHTLNRANWNLGPTPPPYTSIVTCAGYGSGTPYDIVLGDIFTVHPFGNIMNTRTVTGAQLWLALEQGVSRISSATGLGSDGRFPQIAGFEFSFRYDLPSGCLSPASCTVNRIQSVALADGTPIPNDSAATYTMTLPNFVNLGGDGYFMLADGQGATQELDALVLKAYMESFGATPADRLFDPTSYPLDRITKCNGPCS